MTDTISSLSEQYLETVLLHPKKKTCP